MVAGIRDPEVPVGVDLHVGRVVQLVEGASVSHAAKLPSHRGHRATFVPRDALVPLVRDEELVSRCVQVDALGIPQLCRTKLIVCLVGVAVEKRCSAADGHFGDVMAAGVGDPDEAVTDDPRFGIANGVWVCASNTGARACNVRHLLVRQGTLDPATASGMAVDEAGVVNVNARAALPIGSHLYSRPILQLVAC